ncbi:MAG: topoisomerase DNA-binding C4 zinc finger domain-containing protein [Clostridia bacterium]|nr:topoisomerase DNA-binding C4 zinc finger domain-containing protein [Clostridia bacterium]
MIPSFFARHFQQNLLCLRCLSGKISGVCRPLRPWRSAASCCGWDCWGRGASFPASRGGRICRRSDGRVCGEGDVLKLKELTPNQHFTQPPARYTEPTLIKALDDNGIGRPSTYAPIISNILQREYIERDKKSLKPTALGTIVSDLMVEHFKRLFDVKFTAGLEKQLDAIGAGEHSWITTLNDFYADFDKLYKQAEKELDGQRVKVPDVETEEICEKCGRKMVIKSGRFGKFLACPAYPECKTTKPIPEDEVKQPCPKCGSKLVKRRSKKGKTFYGCSNYPTCDFAAPSVPSGETCPECGSYILLGLRGRKYCMNSECPTRVKPAEKTAKKTTSKKSAK